MISNGYEILGVAMDATPEEIKKAYFKQIRLHTPEKDPEGFKKIREAYEWVLSGNMVGKPDFPVKTEEEKLYIQQLQDYIDHKQFAFARDMGEKIVRRRPGMDYVRYLLGIAQRECGNYVKSSNNFIKLLEKYPNDKWLEREAFLSYYERGWVNKGYDMAYQAFEHGCCDIRFIKTYLKCMPSYDYTQPKNLVIITLCESSPRWNRENFLDGISIFNEIQDFFLTQRSRKGLVKGLGDFFSQLGNVLCHHTDWLAKRMMMVLDTGDLEQCRVAVPYYNRLIGLSKERYLENNYLDKYPQALANFLKAEGYPDPFCRALSNYYRLLFDPEAYDSRKKKPKEKALTDSMDSILISCIQHRNYLGERLSQVKTWIPDIYKMHSAFFDALGDQSISSEKLVDLL